jgi:hypothetical protein
LNFHPISLLSDIRLYGDGLVVVDLGSDLGGEGDGDARWVNHLREQLTEPVKTEFERGFRNPANLH